MARKIFFSFHYQRDIFRVNVVRNHYLTKGSYTIAGYWDHSLWEETRLRGDTALKRLIQTGLDGTSVTVVLIGAETSRRPWVNYEIKQSLARGNGFLGIRINSIPDPQRAVDHSGLNPLDNALATDQWGYTRALSSFYSTYDWVADDGYNNLGTWVDRSAQIAGK